MPGRLVKKTDGSEWTAEGDLAIREGAVHEHRNWVRTTYSCNNRCIFCLDGDADPRGHRLDREVLDQIEEGFQPEARLILSGGEASIHPSFLTFIEAGKKMAYGWIQTISNGRMFAYSDFAKQAANAGLNEVTFSMHGHNSELHDELTGIEGSFAQALRGMLNLLKDGRVVVNVDCVINGLNQEHLGEILDFYMGLGIHEFDLLQIVPFGRAWWPENRSRLFYDVEAAQDGLNKVFKSALKPGKHIWTNRFPVSFLEGLESLIQDPHKLFDEMRGRRKDFERFLDTGKKLNCSDRCAYCFLDEYCSSLNDLAGRLEKGDFERIDIDLTGAHGIEIDPSPRLGFVQKLSSHNRIRKWRLHAADLSSAMDWLKTMEGLFGEGELMLDDWTEFLTLHENTSRPNPTSEFSSIRYLICAEGEVIRKLSSLAYKLDVLVTTGTRDALLKLREDWQKLKFGLLFPQTETLSEAFDLLPEPSVFFEMWRDIPLQVRGVPVCLHPGAQMEPATLHLSSLDADGRIDMEGYTRNYIHKGYMAFSRGCSDCARRPGCQGLHINTLRLHGFRQLSPLTK